MTPTCWGSILDIEEKIILSGHIPFSVAIENVFKPVTVVKTGQKTIGTLRGFWLRRTFRKIRNIDKAYSLLRSE